MFRCRQLPALYLLAFFAAAAAAPHHHLDPIADLISDGPSNSGTFAQIISHGILGTGVYPGALVDDVPCLACFNRDFTASPAIVILLDQALQVLRHRPVTPTLTAPTLIPADACSRAPPSPA